MRKNPWLSPEKCTGCGACENICPEDVLHIELDESGHLNPIGEEGCIACGLCERICTRRLALTNDHAIKPKVYVAWSREEDLRFLSTSGGLFSEMAYVILKDGGIIVGAEYDGSCAVHHACVSTSDGLIRLRQSKYVQSRIGKVFRDVKSHLIRGQKVLFSGAPCQIAGLRAYLGKDYSGLYLVDFVCRGVNSPKAYRAWLDELEDKHCSEVANVWFKYKVGGWKTSPKRTRIDFKNGTSVILDGEDNTYMCGYLDMNLYLRPSCAKCEFKGFPRLGDVTVADFWGLDPAIDDDKGASLVMVNSRKGAELFEGASARLISQERTFAEILEGNPAINSSVMLNPKSRNFLDALNSVKFSEALRIYGKPGFSLRIRHLLGKCFKKLIG